MSVSILVNFGSNLFKNSSYSSLIYKCCGSDIRKARLPIEVTFPPQANFFRALLKGHTNIYCRLATQWTEETTTFHSEIKRQLTHEIAFALQIRGETSTHEFEFAVNRLLIPSPLSSFALEQFNRHQVHIAIFIISTIILFKQFGELLSTKDSRVIYIL